MNVVVEICRRFDNSSTPRPRCFHMKQHQRWKVVSVSTLFNVSVGKATTEDFSRKCFSVSGKTCFGACRLFGYKCSVVLTWKLQKNQKTLVLALSEISSSCVSMCLKAVLPKTFKLERSGFSPKKFSKGVSPFGNLNVRQLLEM